MTAIRFSGTWPWWLILLFSLAGAFWIARWYWRETRHLGNPMRWLLPTLRAFAFFLILFMLAGPTLYHQHIQGELSRIRILLDVSKSMATVDDATGNQSRLSRALEWLLGGESKPKSGQAGWLNELKKHHRVEWVTSGNSIDEPPLWDSQENSPLPKSESIVPHGINSPLGDFLVGAMGPIVSSTPALVDSAAHKSMTSHAESLAAVVLITDGQSNSGMSLSDAATRYAMEKVPLFAIGIGSQVEPEDLGILQVDHSQRVYRPDRLRGTILIKERMKLGTPYRVEVKHLEKTVFSKLLQSADQASRSIEFDIPAEQLVDRSKERLLNGMTYTSLPIDLDFSIECEATEVSLDNNVYASSLWGVERKNRVLLLDRRGGWEMRYIKNALERDVAWESSVSIGRSAFAQEFFPQSRVKLFEFDLILASLDTVREFNQEQQTWISDFVGVSGGGLILIDSPRERVASAMEPVLSALLPVRAIDSSKETEAQSLRISPAALNQPAFQISANELPNDQTWSQLPVPKSVRKVVLEPGAEAMVEVIGKNPNDAPQALIATKLFGQGRVIYFATEETWRWRYNVADLYHQRFWTQIATWGMRAPFAVNDAFASLDSGSRIYSTIDLITVRARIKQDDSKPLENAAVNVVLERDGERHASIPLNAEPDARGFYKSTFGPMPEGNYRAQLEVVGIPNDALTLQTQFVVQPPVDIEMHSLACNTAALRVAAAMTGGEFAMLEEAATISEKLKPFRSGKMVESQTLLWQSYPWFATIVGLLAIEWYFRKRVGLI